MDALIALMQRTVFVVPWPSGTEGFRTLVNANGSAALPIFTDRAQLETAARRYGWLAPDGSSPATEVGARQAFTYVRTKGMGFLVVDIAAPHSMEASREEIEPLLSPAARRESTVGPYAGAGRISSTLMQAVRTGPKSTPPPAPAVVGTPSPASIPSTRTPADLGAARPHRPSSLGIPAARPASRSPASETSPGTLGPPDDPPEETLLEALELVLRDYPEIEWACVGSSAGSTVLGLRVDPRVRQRVAEIASRATATVAPRRWPVVLLDDTAQMRAARNDALVFYPWRKR